MQTPHLDVRFAASAAVQARVGLIVPRHKHSAVDRNRLRRRLRELIRIQLVPALADGDTLIRAKAEAYEAAFGSLSAEVESIRAWLSQLASR